MDERTREQREEKLLATIQVTRAAIVDSAMFDIGLVRTGDVARHLAAGESIEVPGIGKIMLVEHEGDSE